jgi:hypothetical protein
MGGFVQVMVFVLDFTLGSLLLVELVQEVLVHRIFSEAKSLLL